MSYKRLTMEEPQGNTGYMLNMTKVINREVFLRDVTGEGDINLVDYCKGKYEKDYDTKVEATAEDFGEYMDDDSLLSLFYWMAVGHAELRLRLAKYEDTGLSPEEIVRLNDFEQSQCAKLLAENGAMMETLKHARHALQDARDCSGSRGLCHECYERIERVIAEIDGILI